jgi:hypothetical protein
LGARLDTASSLVVRVLMVACSPNIKSPVPLQFLPVGLLHSIYHTHISVLTREKSLSFLALGLHGSWNLSRPSIGSRTTTLSGVAASFGRIQPLRAGGGLRFAPAKPNAHLQRGCPVQVPGNKWDKCIYHHTRQLDIKSNKGTYFIDPPDICRTFVQRGTRPVHEDCSA